ncbi:MAG TPA: hypothetical protein VM011_12570 [Gammaproteobacteria bacterium]|nr:hypothetical protein [Gammaproteobacteria bacterium]
MFIGHFGAGFAAKSVAPNISLGTLFLAAQFLDLLWPTLLQLGVERVRIEPVAGGVNPLVFEHYPVSHSLAAVACWALLVGLVYLLIRREPRGAIVLGFLVISHWLLDAIVHRPDLPLLPGHDTLVGLNAWSSLPLTLVIEGSLFALGVWLYMRTTSPVDAVGKWGLAGLMLFLFVIYLGSLFGSPPPSVTAIAWAGQLQWLLVLWGYWIDKHRCVTCRTINSPGIA